MLEVQIPKIRRVPNRSLPKVASESQKNGLRYENNVGKTLDKLASNLGGSCEHGVWFETQDQNGLSHHCVDHIFRLGYCILVIECKLTYTSDAVSQLERYLPLVSATTFNIMPRTQFRSLIICKTVTPECRGIPEIHRLSEPFFKGYEKIPVLQWLGRSFIPW